ncbi:hypothetical protein AALA98_03265 [Lachnospiraceae bacterium 45-W7]
MLSRVQSSYGNGYFSQAVADFAKNNRPKTGQNQEKPKTIGEFSEKEWDKLLEKVDYAIWEYRDDLEHRKEEALDKKREQTEEYILGCSAKAAEELEQLLLKSRGGRSTQEMESGGKEEFGEPKKPDIQDSIEDAVADELIRKLLGLDRQAPYSVMADETGAVTYHGVTFQCDYENNRICLGDVSNLNNCISVSLEKGGCLVFNRDNIGDLAKAIGMFSPEDVNRIMRAIAQDAKLKQTQMQIEDETSGVEVLDRPQEASGAQEASHSKKEEG